MKFLLLPLIALWLLPALASESELAEPSQGRTEFVHCYDFGCKSRMGIAFTPGQWDRLHSLFQPPPDDAAEERQRIRAAIAEMERYAGAISGSEADLGGNYSGKDLPKQQDCIDESTNTLQYLWALEDRGWLKFHRVGPKQRRIVWFISHWTATLREIGSDLIYAVDSWHLDNGQPPYIQDIEDWRRDREFSTSLNPPLPRETARR